MTRPQEPLRGKDEIKLTKWGPVRIVMVSGCEVRVCGASTRAGRGGRRGLDDDSCTGKGGDWIGL